MSEVADITAQMARTTVNESLTNGANDVYDATVKANPMSEKDAAIASAEEGRRLYIGNLAYATTEGELSELFANFAVEFIQIPLNPRFKRPLGHAFVDLSSSSEAERAINELHGTAVRERNIFIQPARNQEPHGEGITNGEGGSGNERRRYSNTRGRSGYGRYRGKFFRGPRNRKSIGTGAKESTEPTANGVSTGVSTDPAYSGINETNQASPPAEVVNEPQAPEEPSNTANVPKTTKKRYFRERRHRGPPQDGVPSKTKIMVANLPYNLSEERLLEVFENYQPSSAKIALRPIPQFMVKKLQARNEPRKGRGFGFVSLPSEELQQLACSEMHGKEVDGREIVVKVAIDSPLRDDETPVVHSEGAGGAVREGGEEAVSRVMEEDIRNPLPVTQTLAAAA